MAICEYNVTFHQEIMPVFFLRWADYWNDRRPLAVRQRSTVTGESPTADVSTASIRYNLSLFADNTLLVVREGRTTATYAVTVR